MWGVLGGLGACFSFSVHPGIYRTGFGVSCGRGGLWVFFFFFGGSGGGLAGFLNKIVLTLFIPLESSCLNGTLSGGPEDSCEILNELLFSSP